jgi:hypothetical protein
MKPMTIHAVPRMHMRIPNSIDRKSFGYDSPILSNLDCKTDSPTIIGIPMPRTTQTPKTAVYGGTALGGAADALDGEPFHDLR